ncbi:hypothetical protein QN386_09995 [Pseudomonas sp. CCI3.2]|uniref:hypothetical protein n=1 Tax=unclassified Pseudomonas TaxID=196821 RepID=UPI002AC8C1CB|nr:MULTISPECIES: hypothetical protein [unclassified Pseudomonas]MEB0077937.1 hypothetical protein [Pseudomonas sp. MH10out]MEB0094060.1 hypothetical protein [Pseudomonas sp. CCI4.2]MEB0101651.1 hypothetical protein [Pseudomonas sp. CCI3.2]MEB0129475.1 hypothetical protein [Pseudomonas sp. CCI2.4]MEB0159155.1 hypothetical protein [Pseudomonas sp. AH2 (2023)]
MKRARTTAGNPLIWLIDMNIETTSGSSMLYANGRQQVEVTLTLETRAEFPLTDAQKKSLRIVVEQSNGDYRPLPEQQLNNDWWYSETKDKYDYYPVAVDQQPRIINKEQSSNQPKAFFQKVFYVLSTAIGGAAIKLRAQASKSEDETYQSIAPLDHSVILSAVRKPDFSAPADYTFTRRLVSGSEALGKFAYEYQLHPTYLFFQSAILYPLGMIQWDDKDPAETRASNVGCASPSQSEFNYNEDVVIGAAFEAERLQFVTYQSPGRLTIVLQGGINIPYHSASANTCNGPCRLAGIDMNGNDHSIGISFTGVSGFEARTNLELIDI